MDFTENENEALKRKSKSPSLLGENDNKKLRTDPDDVVKLEDIAKQYKKFSTAPKFNLNSEELFCICRKPDVEGELMISCDGCEEWFHAKCMKIDPKCTPLLDKFYCKFCEWKDEGVTKWNRKCRMPGCLNPIRKMEKSKYCSDECGEKFLRMKLTGSQALSLGEVSFVVNYCGSQKDLELLGSQFPELPEVLLLDLKKLPENVQKVLKYNEEKQMEVKERYEQSQAKAKYLLRIKEMIAVINEKVQALEGVPEPSENTTKLRKKRSKSKRVDLCCFQHDLHKDLFKKVDEEAVNTTDVREYYKTDIEDVVKSYALKSGKKVDVESDAESETVEGSKIQLENQKMCLQDRRKCLRHNGWVNLLSDRVWKRLIELQAALDKLQREKSEALRNYSVSVYEKKT